MLLALLLAVAGFAFVGLYIYPDGIALREEIMGNGPQAKVEAFVQTIARGDEKATLDLWELPHLANQEQSAALSERRRQVTAELLAARIRPELTILDVEWWGTCCEPSATRDPRFARGAGGARIRVQLVDNRDLSYDAKGFPFIYTFDVFVRDLPYWGGLRHWVIRDVYREGQEPLFWRLVHKETTEFLEWKPTATLEQSR